MKTNALKLGGAVLVLSTLLASCGSSNTPNASVAQSSNLSAQAMTTGHQTDSYTQTPLLNPNLPIINTTHGSDHIKANVLNPYPVCNASEDYRTVVYSVSDNWLPVGTISTYNQTSGPIPLTQTTSKTQTISITVNGSSTQSVSGNLGSSGSNTQDGSTAGGQAGIAFSLARTIGGQASYSLTWNVGQQVGPYQVPAGYTGEATYGFRSVNMSGTQQFCKANGTWSTPTLWTAFVPIKNEVRVKLYGSAVDSADKGQPSQNYVAPLPKPATGVDMTTPASQQVNDLQPYMTVSGAKAAGFAGSAALHIKNVGSGRYYADFPVVSFLVEVKTESGPQGVDRVITPSWFSGAYVQDLGFDRARSTHSYLVTLSNPVELNSDITVAAFSFNDGNTSVGRLKNYVTISQIGRVEGDTSYYNDTLVDSRQTTLNDFGNKIVGIF